MEENRFYYMDSLRSILMMLGVALHTACMYAVNADWAFTEVKTCICFDVVIYIIHAFRLPGFFIISGFFALFILRKVGPESFLKSKITRILLPLVSTALTLNIFETYFRYAVKTDHAEISWFIDNVLIQSFFNGEWDHHLWFLIFVFIFFSVSILIRNVFSENTDNRFERTQKVLTLLRKNGFFLIAFPSGTVLILALAKVLPFTYIEIFGTFTIVEILYWFPFFIFGMWLFADKKLQQEFMQFQKWHLIVLFLFLISIFIRIECNFYNILPREIISALDIFISWYLCLGIFLVGFKYLNKPSKTWQYLSDASYTIYLFHHLLVMLFGYYLSSVEISIFAKFIIINTFVTLITVLIHHFIILRVGFFRLLFNGKRL